MYYYENLNHLQTILRKSIAGSIWRQKAHNRTLWKALGEAYVRKQDNLNATGTLRQLIIN